MTKALKPPKQIQHTGEPSTDTSNLIFPFELRSNTFEEFELMAYHIISISSAYGSFHTRVQRSFCVLSSFIRSRFWGNRRKLFAVFLAKLGTETRVESYAYTVQFVPLFKVRSFITIINIISPSMEPYRMSRRIDLEPGTSHKYLRYFEIEELR